MNANRIRQHSMFGWLALLLATAIALAAAPVARADPPGRYQQHNLVTNGSQTSLPADKTDPNLVNPWGIVFHPFGPVWISDNGAGVSTVYKGDGTLLLTVTIPAAAGGNPTGIVYNGSTGFVVTQPTPPCNTNPCPSGPALFIFATEDGFIAGWNKTADPANAIVVANGSAGAVYKGLALSAGGNGSLLYATDFHNNKIDVFDNAFKPVVLGAGAFTDPKIPMGFAPFGIQAINGNLYVTYAKQNAAAHDDVAGKGLGYVDVYDPNGNLIGRFASKGQLNSPWGLALAPAGFGDFSDSLLVGNFGDGRINAFDLATGHFLGQLKGADGHPLTIDGLWGLAFGNGFLGQPVNTLFFTAGSNGESDGLYGRIDPIPGNGHGHGDD
jgi:uncharacterized protein (TIGR03118 family)